MEMIAIYVEKKIREILQISIDENNKGNFIIVSATFNLDNENIEKIKKECENEKKKVLNCKDDLNKNEKKKEDNIGQEESEQSKNVNISIIETN